MNTPSNNDRPVNLDISTIKLPLAAITSITHRISGVILFVGIGILLYMLDQSLASPESYNRLETLMQTWWAKFVVWGVLSALAYHLVAGIKHLLMDLGLGETREAAPKMALCVVVVSVILIVVLGLWMW